MTHTAQPSQNDDPLWSVDEAADYLGVSPRFIRQRIAAEELACTRLGRLVRVRRSALEDYIQCVTSPAGSEG